MKYIFKLRSGNKRYTIPISLTSQNNIITIHMYICYYSVFVYEIHTHTQKNPQRNSLLCLLVNLSYFSQFLKHSICLINIFDCENY